MFLLANLLYFTTDLRASIILGFYHALASADLF